MYARLHSFESGNPSIHEYYRKGNSAGTQKAEGISGRNHLHRGWAAGTRSQLLFGTTWKMPRLITSAITRKC